MTSRRGGLAEVLGSFAPGSREEASDVERVLQIARAADPWDRSTLLHATGSAIVVHPASGEVLLRWHDRLEMWLQVGGHGEPGDRSAFDVATREAAEETGLGDLASWPDPQAPTLLQVIVVPVPEGRGEPAHEHGDLRFLLATNDPMGVRPEHDRAQLRWMSFPAAINAVEEDSLTECLLRAKTLVDHANS
jgi:8-oxo-dGTP pyrophosphatase MutT (NUDIX family)